MVALRLAQDHYGVGDSISVVVANGLPSEILTADHQSDCTVVTLELQMGGSWQAIASCRAEIVTRLVPIAAGTTLAQTLHPNGGVAPQATWQPGTYRIMLSFFTKGASASQALQVLSSTFTIS
jgi:hypothetical protein